MNFADGRGALPLEGLKDALGKFLAHADTGVLNSNYVQTLALRRVGQLCHPDRHCAARRGKLDRIGQQVQQHLIQTGLVTVHILVGDIYDVHVLHQLFGMNLPADDGLNIMENIGQVDFLLL